MEFTDSSLYREVQAITESSNKPVHYTWSAEIHVGKDTYPVLKVMSIDFQDDFESKYSTEIIGRMALLGGVYAKWIYPSKDNLEMTLYRVPLHEATDVNNTEAVIESERYRVTLVDTGNPIVEGNGANTATEDILNLTNIFEVDFQLVNKAVEQLRMISIGGIYRNVTVEDVVKGVLTSESKKVSVEGVRIPQGVDMIKASNQNKRDHVIIPHGTKLVDLPAYVHHKCGGMYSAGLGYYLFGDYWYIYPCFDSTRFNQEENTLTVVNVPRNKLPDTERSYRQDGSNLVVLATGDVKLRDDTESRQLNEGNGVRFSDANNFMDGFTTVKGNKAYVSRGKNNSEFISTERKTGLNNVPVSSNHINANPYLERSKLAKRQGSVLGFVWENSNPKLLYPGMPVKVLYLSGDEIKTIYGTLLKAHHYVQLKGKGYTDIRYATRSVLSVFISVPEET